MGRLGSGLQVMGRFWSRVWVSAIFQVFALTAGGCSRWEGKLSGEGNVRGEYVRGASVLNFWLAVCELCGVCKVCKRAVVCVSYMSVFLTAFGGC